MPLLPEIALQAKLPQVEPFDPYKAMLAASQLGQSQSGNLLNQLKLMDAAQTMQRERAMADLFARQFGGRLPASTPPPSLAGPPVPPNPLTPQEAGGAIMQTPFGANPEPQSPDLPPGGAPRELAPGEQGPPVPVAPPPAADLAGTPSPPAPVPAAPVPAGTAVPAPASQASAPARRPYADPAFHAEIMQADPRHGKDYIKFFMDLDKQQTTADTEALKLRQAQVEMVISGSQFVTDQPSYDALLASLRATGLPLHGVPTTYTPATVQKLVQTAVPIKDRIDTKVAEFEALTDPTARRAAVTEQHVGPIRTAEKLREQAVLAPGQTAQKLREQTELAPGRLKEAQQQAELDLAKQLAADKALKGNQPNYGLGDRMDTAIYSLYGTELGPRGTPTPEQVSRAQQFLQHQDVERARHTQEVGLTAAGQKAYDAAVNKPLDETSRNRMVPLLQGEEVVKALLTEFTPEERARYVGLGGLRMRGQQLQQLQADARSGKGDPKFARFAALVNLQGREAFTTAGQALSAHEKNIIFGYIPTGREWSATEFEEKLALSNERIPGYINQTITLATTPAKDLAQARQEGRLTGTTPREKGSAANPLTMQDVDTMIRREKNLDATAPVTAEDRAAMRERLRKAQMVVQ